MFRGVSTMHPPTTWSRLKGSGHVEAGQQFMPSRRTVGTATVGTWRVIELFETADGRSCVRLANSLDPSQVKTFARAALLDRKLFHRVG